MKTSSWTAVINDVATLDAKLAALQTDNPLLQIEEVIPLGQEPNRAVIVFSVPV